MPFETKLQEVQKTLKEQHLDGWLLYDFRGSNPLAYTFLEIVVKKTLTRRLFYWIPQQGSPVKIVSSVEPHAVDHLPGENRSYRSWQELDNALASILKKRARVAMEYSPYNALPIVSKVDAGTIELVKKLGVEVVSSANILQKYTSVWTEQQWQSHLAAANVLDHTVDSTWRFIAEHLKGQKTLNEYQVQQFMLHEMERQGCLTADAPTCAVNTHSADPHYYPKENQSAEIKPGDFILLDLWCKKREPKSVYADITRVGVAAAKPTARQQEIFHHVKTARDQATAFIQSNYQAQQSLQGWQVDQVCRDSIQQAGYGPYFVHRTGHNIGEEVHGPGANLDNFETHDFRELLPGTCFSVEPGIYLPEEFGIRLEYDVYLHPSRQAEVTGGIQTEIKCLL